MYGLLKNNLDERKNDENNLLVYFFLATVVLLSYGYEIFNFNLTIDEEVHAVRYGRLYMDWILQGRWGMALLNFVVLQNPIIPAVSVFLGLAGTVTGLFLYFKSYPLDRFGLSMVVGLAISVPSLAFTFTFSTLAYGIGFGFLAIAISHSLLHKQQWWALGAACFLSAFAISVYQTFVFILVMNAIIGTINLWSYKDTGRFSILKKFGTYVIGSVAAYFMLNSLVLTLVSQDIQYIGQYVDLKGFFSHPIERSLASYERVMGIFQLQPSLFGEHSNWLGIVVLVAILFSLVYPLLTKQYWLVLRASIISFSLLTLIVLADAISPSGAPIRSVIYIPVGIAIIVATAYTLAGQTGKKILVSLSVLAIIGNSMINNHLHASSHAAELKDRMLAEDIIHEARLLSLRSGREMSSLKVELIGSHAWPSTAISSRMETFGASFFEWDAGNRGRVAAYLSLNGFPVGSASDEDRIRVYDLGKKMPVWPHNGWIALDGDILVLKFSEYSPIQKESLCKHGFSVMCN